MCECVGSGVSPCPIAYPTRQCERLVGVLGCRVITNNSVRCVCLLIPDMQEENTLVGGYKTSMCSE